MAKVSGRKILLLVTAMLFCLPSCKTVISQDPTDSFMTKRFPRQLELMRGQIRELSQKERDAIVDRSKKDSQRTDLLRVGVIDNGVDIAHKDLQSQIDYRIVNGRVEGAGFDIMGKGASGSHVLVDPSLFAFGAQEIRKGVIVAPVENPLLHLKNSNDIYAESVYRQIHEHPILKGTVFAEIPKEAFSLYQVLDIREDYPLDEQIKDLKEQKAKEYLSIDKLRAEGLLNFEILLEEHKLKILEHISKVEHGDLVLEAIRDAVLEVDSKTKFEENLKKYEAYLKGHLGDHSDVKESIKPAFDYVVLGMDAFDPISKLEQLMRVEPNLQGRTFVEVAEALIESVSARIDEAEKNRGLTDQDKKTLKNGRAQLKNIRAAAIALQEVKHDPEKYKEMRSALRRYIVRTQHPYLVAEGNSTSHGTHVSGVVAHQNKNVRIVPIRVTTSSFAPSEKRKNEIISHLAVDFAQWLKQPIIQELRKTVGNEYGGVNLSERTEVSLLKEKLNKEVINALFVEEVIRAVEVAGENQLKLANVSLGLTFKKDHDLNNKKQSYINDLFSEYVRFRIGQTMMEKAPGTLFIVATGNDGGWVDGVSKTAFPVGITSSRLLTIAKEKGLPDSPNNSLKNTIAVGSVNIKGTLTPFTNILIDPKIPQVFSTGKKFILRYLARIKHSSKRPLIRIFEIFAGRVWFSQK